MGSLLRICRHVRQLGLVWALPTPLLLEPYQPLVYTFFYPIARALRAPMVRALPAPLTGPQRSIGASCFAGEIGNSGDPMDVQLAPPSAPFQSLGPPTAHFTLCHQLLSRNS
jgi:hypothetical protein